MFLVIFLAAVGAIAVAIIIIDSLWSLFELVTSHLMPYFLPTEVQPLSKRFGPWAVVTGSTDGIGKQYALELAHRGINIVLISRNPDKLRKVASEIEKLHSVKTKIIVADFSTGTEVYKKIEEELKDIPVGILVNNVGLQYEYPMPFCELPAAKAWEMINVNVVAVTSMSRMLLPRMVERGRGAIVNMSSGSELQPLPLMAVYAASKYPMPFCELPTAKAWEMINVNVVAVTSMSRMLLPRMVERGRGAIVNMSSGSELQPLPLMAVYSASKVYVRNFTFAIREEYAPKGIHIQHLSPLFVSTKMNTFSQRLLDGNLLVPDAATYAQHAVATLGRVHTTTGYWLHGIQYFFITLAPEWMRIKIGTYLNREFRAEHRHNTKLRAQ